VAAALAVFALRKLYVRERIVNILWQYSRRSRIAHSQPSIRWECAGDFLRDNACHERCGNCNVAL